MVSTGDLRSSAPSARLYADNPETLKTRHEKMADVRSEIDIDAPPDTIWNLICDPSRYPEFADPTDRMLEIPKGDFGTGSVYREFGGIPPFKDESTWTVTEFDPKQRQVHVGDDGSMTLHLTISIRPAGDGSRLVQTLRLEPRWYLKPVFLVLWPLMLRKRARAAMDVTVRNVKRICESDSG